MSQTLVIVSVDTEGDQWTASRENPSVENIREVPRFQEHCNTLGIPVTYFTTHGVAATPWAAAVLRDINATGRAEVGAHLHPWDTPPLSEPFVPRNTMTKNLPAELQRAKLATLTNTLEQSIGVRPRSFRAGRFGFGPETARALIALGYRVDSSVTPWVSWEATDDGANFVGAPLSAYTLDGTTDVREPVLGGPLVEIPLSCGYSRWPFDRWHSVLQTVQRPVLRPFRLAGIASRLGIARSIILSPEVSSVADMAQLARLLVRHGVSHISLFFHSPSLVPGLSPFVRNNADLQRLYSAIAEFRNALERFTTPLFTTVSDAASRLIRSS